MKRSNLSLSLFSFAVLTLLFNGPIHASNLEACKSSVSTLTAAPASVKSFRITSGTERLIGEARKGFLRVVHEPIAGNRWYSFAEIFGGLNREYDPSNLVGLKVFGLQSLHWHGDFNDQANRNKVYFGEIVEARHLRQNRYGEHEYSLKVRNSNGTDEFLFLDRTPCSTCDLFYVLGPEKPLNQVLESAMTAASFDVVIRELFGEPTTSADYDIAIAATQLFLELPSFHGVTSVVKTLRGQGEKTKSRLEFGMASGSRRYGPKQLERFTRTIEKFAENLRLLVRDGPSGDEQGAPDWMVFRRTSDLATQVLTHLKTLKESKTSDDNAIAPKTSDTKPKTAGDFNRAALKVTDTSRVENRAMELRDLVGSQHAHVTLHLGRFDSPDRLRRISTKKNSDGTTTIVYLIQGMELMAHNGRSAHGLLDVEGYYLASIEITFSDRAEVIKPPEYFWRFQKNAFGNATNSDLVGKFPAPELKSDQPGRINPAPFQRQITDDIVIERKVKLAVESVTQDSMKTAIQKKLNQLRAEGFEGIRGDGRYAPDRNLILKKKEPLPDGRIRRSYTLVAHPFSQYTPSHKREWQLGIEVYTDRENRILEDPKYSWEVKDLK